MTTAIVLFGTLALLLIIGVPISISLGAATMLSMLTYDVPLAVVGQRMFTALDSVSIMAIPFFVLAGNLMTQGGISRRLVDFANRIIGNVRGGMCYAMVLACAFFAALSGSAPATVLAIGSMLYPEMVKLGYPKARCAGLLTVSGGLGPIIPPSIIMVVYCTITNSSVGDMFKAGLIAGAMIGVVLIGICIYLSHKEQWPKNEEKITFKELWKSFIGAIPAIFLPVIILGGIYSGLFTPTEASAVACFYCLIIGLFVYRELNFKSLGKVVFKSVKTAAGIMLIVAATQAFGWVLTRAGIPQMVAEGFTSVISSPTVFMFAVVFILIIAGCFIDAVPALLIFAPILIPTATQYGISLIHFGVVMVVTLCIGLVTPPVGINLFVASSVGGQPIHKIIPHLPVLIASIIAGTIAIVLIPGISTLLPALMK